MSADDGVGATADGMLDAAAAVMSDHLGKRVRLEPVSSPGGERKPVLRCRLIAAPPAAPEAVIVKHAGSRAGPPPLGLLNECAALRFLSELRLEPPVSPAFYGADIERGVIVLEDLGDADSLADRLLGSDAAMAEAALVAFAVALGRMQAAAIPRIEAYRRMRSTLGPTGGEAVIEARALADAFRRALAGVGVALGGARDDVDTVVGRVARPGAFLALVHGDACPSNERLVDGEAVLLDFATTGPRHALLDGVCGRVPFPSCWCVRRLPEHVAPRMEAAYRAQLVRGCAAARDDPAYEMEAATATAYWLIETTTVALSAVPFRDVQWGTSTVGQRLAYRTGRFSALSGRLGAYRALAAVLCELVDVLGIADREMPLYPAFGGPPAR